MFYVKILLYNMNIINKESIKINIFDHKKMIKRFG